MTLTYKIPLYKELSIHEILPVFGKTFNMSQQLREKWTPSDKEEEADLLADGTDYRKKLMKLKQMLKNIKCGQKSVQISVL